MIIHDDLGKRCKMNDEKQNTTKLRYRALLLVILLHVLLFLLKAAVASIFAKESKSNSTFNQNTSLFSYTFRSEVRERLSQTWSQTTWHFFVFTLYSHYHSQTMKLLLLETHFSIMATQYWAELWKRSGFSFPFLITIDYIPHLIFLLCRIPHGPGALPEESCFCCVFSTAKKKLICNLQRR